jgi:hypothetical protein
MYSRKSFDEFVDIAPGSTVLEWDGRGRELFFGGWKSQHP